jgi:hypothetical protein
MWSQQGLQAGSPAWVSNTDGWNPIGPDPLTPLPNTLVRPVTPALEVACNRGECTMRMPSAMGAIEVSVTM